MLIDPYPWSAPLEDARLKSREPAPSEDRRRRRGMVAHCAGSWP